MDDLISRQAAIDAVREFYDEFKYYDDGKSLEDLLSELPSAEPQRKKGKWVILPPTDAWIYICDQCGRRSDFNENFCPNCGAEMGKENHKHVT